MQTAFWASPWLTQTGAGLWLLLKCRSWPVAAHKDPSSSPLLQVTASDDRSWKMWHLPRGDLIMAGEGHKDWVAGISFHPKVSPFVHSR